MHVGEAEVAASVAVGELFVVEAEQMEYGRMQVMHGHRFFDGAEAELVGGSVNGSTFHSAASQPACEAVMVVVASVELR